MTPQSRSSLCFSNHRCGALCNSFQTLACWIPYALLMTVPNYKLAYYTFRKRCIRFLWGNTSCRFLGRYRPHALDNVSVYRVMKPLLLLLWYRNHFIASMSFKFSCIFINIRALADPVCENVQSVPVDSNPRQPCWCRQQTTMYHGPFKTDTAWKTQALLEAFLCTKTGNLIVCNMQYKACSPQSYLLEILLPWNDVWKYVATNSSM